MSVPSVILNCDKCVHESSSRVLWGSYEYFIDDQTFHLNKQLGWCNQCHDFSPIENLDPAYYLEQVRDIEVSINELQTRAIMLFLNPILRNKLAKKRQKLNKASKLLKAIQLRQGMERCLKCSSIKVFKAEIDYTLEYSLNMGLYSGEKHTGFLHPSCGGEFIATPCPIRFNVKHIPRYYNLDGVNIACL